ncbi:flagellar assembly protein FliW [Clostridium magnum]|uniref:Flagellar assembly factor FliW n=1 Tax=Clostridium magnum DSM 2767 TaxID=1121326 RepID=A0A162ULQ5_9CLOT|nr:flagellar assembly protein FliW [Clostridium magnum]KZL94057.1 flagellar assembly factor FliW [Clostridium magnum DSM 2767]SHI01239.1 flagellar assembly factor FliW [Clostridium magnum DSM 2767]
MKLNTKYHGVREYEEKDILSFKKGLPGFEGLNKFIIFPVEDNEIFSILHSLEDDSIGLVVVSPFYVIKNYEFKLEDEKIDELKIESPEDVLVLNTVTLNSAIEKITVNLKAPIIINIKNKLGEQIILDNPNYSIRHSLFEK